MNFHVGFKVAKLLWSWRSAKDDHGSNNRALRYMEVIIMHTWLDNFLYNSSKRSLFWKYLKREY